MDNYFSRDYRVVFYDCDRYYRLKPDIIIAWAGELAGDQLLERNIARETLWASGQVFILTRCSIKFLKTPHYNDVVTVSTCERGTKGAKFIRGYDIKDEKGELVVDALSSWVLINHETRQLLRPRDYAYTMNDTDRPTLANLDRIRFEQALPQNKAGEYRFMYCDLDANHHVNNGAYVKLVQNFAPSGFNERDFDEFDISFHHEAVENDIISIHSYKAGADSYAVLGVFSDGKTCFEAMIKVK